MGSWLFGCFGGGRRERLPRLTSARNNNKHHRSRECVKTLPLPSSSAPRPLLLQNSEILPHPAYKCDPLLGGVGAHPDDNRHCQLRRDGERVPEENQLRVAEEELGLRGSLQLAADDDTTFHHRLSLPTNVQAPERYTSNAMREDGIQDPYAGEGSTCGAEESPAAEDVHVEWASSPETEPDVKKPKVPRAAPGLFIFPRKRGFGYRSSVWQEPLSPVAESESSIASDEEPRCSSKQQQEAPPSSSPCGLSRYSRCETDVEITPVRCSSPVFDPKDDKENMFPAGDKGVRVNQATSVLTPVGNLMQWRQLKQENTQKATGEEPGAWEEDDDDDADKYSFFRELQESSSGLLLSTTTPQPSQPPGFLPNTTRKYMEDQKVAWHSTPFEVRLDKALASGSAAPARTVLF